MAGNATMAKTNKQSSKAVTAQTAILRQHAEQQFAAELEEASQS